ncbi:hypothetical protein GMLC_07540 [Geomonas limicola]|uniref:YbhB/YbcL family Raf kinase inhibitor-like protein n=1 Tax=Geomonas limicola TaxID=2740186 RepID=A0A6V8N3P7_9BACT|nr:YbhB/YbcL family Raf kinase inhibitor-like protein [Geomonas limicola]GFO67175.1 hypothetical protein GMLC_07540 [Geomonas limicola]
MEFKLTSPAFNSGTQIPSKYTCDGDNINPYLVIHGVPKGTRSLALLLEDLDVLPLRSVHWVVWNINPELGEIKEHSAPHGAQQGVNVQRKHGYLGPCPQDPAPHRYLFRLYALDCKLDLAPTAGRSELEEAMASHVMATTELIGTYARTNLAPI